MNVSHEIPLQPEVPTLLPDTARLLQAGHMVVHPRVYQVNLEGSRGLNGCPRPDSDIDLSLLVDDHGLTIGSAAHEELLREVLHCTLAAWHGSVELDLAAIFDQRQCVLPCFDQQVYDLRNCPAEGGVDCCGLYKVQRGFTGYVSFGVRMELLYPTLILWRR